MQRISGLLFSPVSGVAARYALTRGLEVGKVLP